MGHVKQLTIRVAEQCLYVLDDHQQVVRQYPVSTSRYGIGNRDGSYQTPLGRHHISDKIGADADEQEVFIGRQAQGRLDELQQQGVELPADIIMARILRLAGDEPGVNQGDDVDSYRRYIYIHGTSEQALIGQPASHGCIRMRNRDVIELFDMVEPNTAVLIEP